MGNARLEASERLNRRYDVRVLEPSPPAVDAAPWFADDPAVPGERGELPIVGPTTAADITWDDLCRRDPLLAEWASERWLGAWRRLGPPPRSFARTRFALHALAEHVLAPARQRVNGKIGLRFTRAGFGTPFFGNDEQLRVEAGTLVHSCGASERRERITTVARAAAFVGIPSGATGDVYTPTTSADENVPLDVHPTAATYLGDIFGFATSVLEELRARATSDERPSRVQLWPEHFDVAVEIGDEAAGRRAGYGMSPGDQDHHEPYLYVVPWGPCPQDPWWNATYFDGARCDLSTLIEVEDQRAQALSFFEEGRRRLGAHTAAST